MNPEKIEQEAKRLSRLVIDDPSLSDATAKEIEKVIKLLGPGEISLFFRFLEEHSAISHNERKND